MASLSIVRIFWTPLKLHFLDREMFSIPFGAKNGVKNGLELLVDTEAAEYAFFPHSSKGFIIAVSDGYERPVLSQQGR